MFQAHRVSVVTFHGPAEKRIFAPYNSGFSCKMRTKTPRGIQAMNSNYMLPLRRKTCWCGAASPPVSTDDRPPYGRSPRLSSAGPPRCRPVSHKDIWYGNGGGNNSTFTNHVVTSSGTDTYSAMAASLGSLKGPRHGGANIKVVKMFEDMKSVVKDWTDEDEISAYLTALLNREAFDHSGLIYGMGHAVYSLSDPRANILKSFVENLSKEKGREEEFRLYSTVARLAKDVIAKERRIYKGVSANVDFYSGFVYSMLDLPTELFTPMFASARMVGWSAHRIEELVNNGKIIRPAYKAVQKHQNYVPLEKRQ